MSPPLVSPAVILLIAANTFVFLFVRSPYFQQDVNAFILSLWSLFQGRIYTVFTSGFLHRNLLHLIFNMLGVYVFGRIVERRFGFLKTIFIYFGALGISLLFSVVIYAVIFFKNVAIIGASGAVMGLMATAMLIKPFPMMIPGWLFLYADLRGFFSGETDGVSHLAHLMGLGSIAILVYFLEKKDRKVLRTGLIINILSFVAFIILRNL